VLTRLFSTTTGWPHFVDSLSATNRAVISAPEPGPSGMMKRTERCGHCWADVCACTGSAATIAKKQNEIVKNKLRKRRMITPGIVAAESGENLAYKRTTE